MLSFETIILGLALAVDAAVVSFTYGLLCLEIPHKNRFARGVLTSFVFGLFQFLMLWIGSRGGHFFSFSSYGYLFQVVIGAIFLILAIKCIQESFEGEKAELVWGMGPLFILALVTSIDALAAGVSFGTLPGAHWVALEVGGVTWAICFLFFLSSSFLQKIPDKWLLRLAALIFIFLGARVILGTMV